MTDGRIPSVSEAEPIDGQTAVVLQPLIGSGGEGRRSGTAALEETAGLARAIALDVAHGEVVNVRSPRPATLFGGGTVERLGEIIAGLGHPVVIVGSALSPVQQRNLERAWQAKVIDRTALILEIFGERARTREGSLQVELAHLSYQRSRLVRSWTHLERQRGGLGFVGGPGETQIEIDRRLITDRIARIRKELEQVVRTRGLHRDARRRVPYPVVALVGYTNAGKSTLFNRLTSSAVTAEDMLFATLDPTMRSLTLPSGQQVILSDTVGFVSDLPHDLVAAFRATLEEVVEADIVVHVRDISHPDTEAQKRDVLEILEDLGVDTSDEARVVEAWNKLDLLPEEERSAARARADDSGGRTVALSALDGEGCDALLRVLASRAGRRRRVVDIDLPNWDGAGLAWLYDHGEVLRREDGEERIALTVRLDEADIARFEQRRN